MRELMQSDFGRLLIDTLAKNTDTKWKYNSMSATIREAQTGFCPVCYGLRCLGAGVFAGVFDGVAAWSESFKYLNRPLTPQETNDVTTIVTAADSASNRHRKDLVQLLGLTV